MVLRLDFYVGERDSFGIGFSDNVICHRQLFVRAVLGDRSGWSCMRTSISTTPMTRRPSGRRWSGRRAAGGSQLEDPGFAATFGIEVFRVPETGDPIPLGEA